MTSIRRATVEDIARLAELGRKFHDAAKPEWPWSGRDFESLMTALIDAGHVTISAGGFMAGLIQPHPLNQSWRVAHELLWWSQDASGPRHFRAFRNWAKAQKADEIRWSCRDGNDRVKRFYSNFSRPVEAVYSEAL